MEVEQLKARMATFKSTAESLKDENECLQELVSSGNDWQWVVGVVDRVDNRDSSEQRIVVLLIIE